MNNLKLVQFTNKILNDADHGFHGRNVELAQLVSGWL